MQKKIVRVVAEVTFDVVVSTEDGIEKAEFFARNVVEEGFLKDQAPLFDWTRLTASGERYDLEFWVDVQPTVREVGPRDL
jgi:hypothetical protein